jgi:hypothetical protein
MNLINKLKNNNGNGRKSAMSLFGLNKDKVNKNGEVVKEIKELIITFNPFENSTNIPQQPSIPEQTKTLQPLTPSPFPQTSTTLDNILENHESQIKLGLAHDNALALLNKSVDLLTTKLDDVRADKLPTVVAAASKVVESIRRERAESSKNNKDREVHYHFYTPQQHKVEDYEVIDVGAVEAR